MVKNTNDSAKKPIPMQTAILASGCIIEWYDFQFYKKSNPPEIDENSVVLKFPKL